MMKTALVSLLALALTACGSSSQEDAGAHDAQPREGGSGGRDAGQDAARQDASHDAGPRDASHDTAHHDAASNDAGDAGQPCYANTDCAGGSCSYSQTVCTGQNCTTGPACPGSCVPFAAKGGFCLAGAPPACNPDSGLVCDPFRHQCQPASSETLPVVSAGQPCGLGVATCDTTSYCYAPVFPDNGTCLPLGQDGGACPPDSVLGNACAGSLICEGFGSGGDAGTCRPPAGPGGSCLVPPAGAGAGNSGCGNATVCSDGGCVALPTSGPCVAGQCLPDAGYCGEAGTCVAFAANGASCTSASDCRSQLCASTTHTCVAALPIGAACGSPYDCTGGLCAGDQIGCASGICDTSGVCATSMCAR